MGGALCRAQFYGARENEVCLFAGAECQVAGGRRDSTTQGLSQRAATRTLFSPRHRRQQRRYLESRRCAAELYCSALFLADRLVSPGSALDHGRDLWWNLLERLRTAPPRATREVRAEQSPCGREGPPGFRPG